MKDHVSAFSDKGLAVGCVTQESFDTDKANVKDGHYQLVFFSPEALLGGHRWRQMLQGELKSLLLSYTARFHVMQTCMRALRWRARDDCGLYPLNLWFTV